MYPRSSEPGGMSPPQWGLNEARASHLGGIRSFALVVQVLDKLEGAAGTTLIGFGDRSGRPEAP